MIEWFLKGILAILLVLLAITAYALIDDAVHYRYINCKATGQTITTYVTVNNVIVPMTEPEMKCERIPR